MHLRIARPTDALEPLNAMCRDGLGLHRLGGFTDHAGFDGGMLGIPGAGFRPVPAHNPYWDIKGRTFEAIDGCRVGLIHPAWPVA